MNRRETILAAMAAAGANARFSPVQMQKLLFLIDREVPQLVGGPHFAFVPYDYGPFDRRVYDELERLEEQGLTTMDRSSGYRRYALTSRGFAQGDDLLSSLNHEVATYIEKVGMWVRSLTFQQLVAAIYKKYPEMKANSIFRQ
jgi:uncharacterized protein